MEDDDRQMKKDRLVTIRSNRYGLDIELDPDTEFAELLEILAEKLRDSARFFKDASMALSFSGRNLDRMEESRILDVISTNSQIEVLCIIERNDKNEPMYKSIVEQALSDMQKQEGEFYRGTLESRQALETESSIVILGDVEPGARVVAAGNIVVMGALYGSAHAGAAGDRNAFIAALAMQPKKLCIGDIEAKRQIICQESLSIKGPKIAVVDGSRIYVDPLVY